MTAAKRRRRKPMKITCAGNRRPSAPRRCRTRCAAAVRSVRPACCGRWKCCTPNTASWRGEDLFAPAIQLATDGFAVPPRMAAAIAEPGALRRIRAHPEMAAYFLDADGNPPKTNSLIRNPALAQTFGVLAERGAGAFYEDGPIARAIVASIRDQRWRPHYAGRHQPAGSRRLPRQEAAGALFRLSPLRDLRHAAAVFRRHRGGANAGHPGKFRPVPLRAAAEWIKTAASRM